MARALNLCLFVYIERFQNILDDYLFWYRLSHRLRTFGCYEQYGSGLVFMAALCLATIKMG
jgi:hypothetical protein